jgi:DNA modification methylase
MRIGKILMINICSNFMKTSHKVIIGDSRWMKGVPDASIHLIITSPPYWQLKDCGNGKQIGFNDT